MTENKGKLWLPNMHLNKQPCNTMKQTSHISISTTLSMLQPFKHSKYTLRLRVMRLILNIIFGGVIIVLAY